MDESEIKSDESESKVVYEGDDGATRAIRGIVRETGNWLIVHRRSGDVRIPLSRVISIRDGVRP